MRSQKPAGWLLRLSAWAACAVLLAGCAATAPPLQQDAESAALEDRARSAEEAGELRAALELYRQLADSTRGSARAGYLVEAARLAVALDDTARANEWLREAEADANAAQLQAIVVRRAEIDLHDGRAPNVLARLNQLRQPMPMDVMTDAQGLRGQALFALGRVTEALQVLIDRETWLETSQAILENQRIIWEGLASSSEAASAASRTGDPLVDGWLALAPIAASGRTGAELRGALIDWRREHIGHPAASGLLAELLAADRSAEYPQQVALLLPLSSARIPSIAIRDGFLAAHLGGQAGSASRNAEMSIRVYDTGLLGAEEAYRRAQLEGADFIVGPLLRPDIEQILPQAGLTPTLALNNVDAETAFVTGFWQFGLAPEDETRAIARRAYADGARTAVALVPLDGSDWGNRLLNSFRAEFEALGGRLLAYETYDPAAQDFSRPIRALLNLEASEQRHTRLAANLGIRLGFEPRRRQDVDMLFLAARNRSIARLLVPALRYHDAADIPTYANSEVYEPTNAARDGDLNNIYFPDARWLLEPSGDETQLRSALQSYWPQRAAAGNLRLYGMGVDAYRLVGALYSGAGQWPLEGLSGSLELDADGRVRRLLPFAQFLNGRPVALEPVALDPVEPERRATSRPRRGVNEDAPLGFVGTR